MNSKTKRITSNDNMGAQKWDKCKDDENSENI